MAEIEREKFANKNLTWLMLAQSQPSTFICNIFRPPLERTNFIEIM
jgi:hypothetical protein